MPSLDKPLYKKFLKEYLPSENELFYKSYHQSLDVYWKNKSDKIIEIIETTHITVSTANKKLHKLPYKFLADFPKDKNLTYKIETLKIDGKCHLSKVQEEGSEDNGIIKKTIQYSLDLEGQREYSYFRSMKRSICLDHEPFIVLVSGKHTNKPRVSIKCQDKDIKAYFTSTGTLRNFNTISGLNNSYHMEEQYPELMMKAQGYSIYFGSK